MPIKAMIHIRKIFIYTFPILLLCACNKSNKHYKTLLCYDELTQVNPDSALADLKRLDISDYSVQEKAYYALLLTQATDKSQRPLLSCDSLLDVALKYYGKKKGLNKAKALYYKGKICALIELQQEAIINFSQGLDVLKDTRQETLRLKSMIHTSLSDLYSECEMYEYALHHLKNALTLDSLRGDFKFMVISLNDLGMTHVLLDQKDKALSALHRAMSLAFAQKDTILLHQTLHNLSLTYNNYENEDSALYYAQSAIKYSTAHEDTAEGYLLLGTILLQKGENDSAKYYIEKGLNAEDIRKQAIAYSYLADIAEVNQDYQHAFEYKCRYTEVRDSIYSINKRSEIERFTYKYEIETRALKEKNQLKLLYLSIVSFLLTIILACILIVQVIRHKHKIAQLTFQKKVAVLEQTIAEEKDRLAFEKAQLYNTLFKKTPIYRHIENLSKQERKDKKGIQVLVTAEQKELKEVLFDIYHDYITHLRTACPQLTDEDCIYCCLRLCDFDDLTIAYCFGNTSKQIVAQRRFRLKTKMAIN